jgi:hypothetical protein
LHKPYDRILFAKEVLSPVFRAEDYLYSSAVDYAGGKGMSDNVIVI